MKRFRYLIFLSPILLSGCLGGESGFDAVGFVKNPVIMGIIFITALWFMFKSRGK